ncbi:TetR/AcrR family transcriptional regulator [Herbiconiux sp. CPCC 203407]|uniref:TetR/AcrR family transcriptional regulator n=1 Tax=Herbiconiux oxytropis TaxID=2970915 RepID=A0AA41XGJ2_9MICO|nr:TetR/AcrR family transcriptional regulator [Herbiconiux oxytropis]MCS5723138.1 TetR/AcrR family transcriptional regulator [Herbiconiux oxytropis]MCS5725305.1 TetR/AcrR family transcriptional regulator [Herbiconiux oxytropis]
MPETLTPPRAPRKDALENREAIVAAAATVFRREPEASLDAVAAEAGLSRRSIYGHFASRDELLAELLTRGGSRISTVLAGVHHDDPRIHLALVGAALWAEVQQVRVLAQLAVHGPLERTVAEALEPVRASVRDAVTRGVAAGWFRDDVAPETLARLIEEAAIAVLDEAVRADLTEPEGARLVMTIGLSVAGLSWQSAAAVADALPGPTTTATDALPGATATASTALPGPTTALSTPTHPRAK